jgi:uncharacterized BrkB/YihY/UPF0761 family membrane protein
MLLLFMLWVYFSWVLVLFGASVSFCLHQKEVPFQDLLHHQLTSYQK